MEHLLFQLYDVYAISAASELNVSPPAAFSNPKMSLKNQDIRLGLISFRFGFEREE
jgi:hypothetical protein